MQVGEAEFGLGGRKLPEQGNGVVRFALFEVGQRQIVPVRSMAGVELECFLKTLDRSRRLVLLKLADAEEIEGLRGGRAAGDGARETNFRLGEFRGLEIGDAGFEVVLRRPAAAEQQRQR